MRLVNKSEYVSPSLSVIRTVLGFTLFTTGRSNELYLEPYLQSTVMAPVPEHVVSDLKHT
jgi:hypothetical protein